MVTPKHTNNPFTMHSTYKADISPYYVKRLLQWLVWLGMLGLGGFSQAKGNPAVHQKLDACNVLWHSPSENEDGTMPIGSGDLAASVWVEPTGDLLFYISKSDAWTGGIPMHAPYQTVVEGRVEQGEVVDVQVTPESRRNDLSVMD